MTPPRTPPPRPLPTQRPISRKIPMAPVIPARLKKGGIFITSGIIDFKEQEVKEALEKAGFEILETNYQGEWVNITAKKC